MSVVTAQNNGKRGLADDVKALDIASALERMKTQTVDSRIQGSVRVFGCHGVGAVTTDEACVRIDGNKVEVFLPEKVYDSLLKKALSKEPEALNKGNLKEVMKKLLLEPDELATIDGFANYLPLFNAISSCSLAVADVTYESPKVIREVGELLEKEHQVISEKESSGSTEKSTAEFGPEFTTGALERYNENKLEPPLSKKPAGREVQREETQAEKVTRYTFSNKAKFYIEAAALPPAEKAAFFEIGKVIEQKGSITKDEGFEIFSKHYKKYPLYVFGRRFSDFIFSDCLKLLKEGEQAKEVTAKVQEPAQKESVSSVQKSMEVEKPVEVVTEPAKEATADGYALLDKKRFAIYAKNIGEMRPEEEKALKEILEKISRHPLRKSEIEEICQAHRVGGETLLEYLVRNGMMETVDISEEEAQRHGGGGKKPLTLEQIAERKKEVVAMLVGIGMKEEDIWDTTKEKSPKAIREILDVCKMHGYDILNGGRQGILKLGPGDVTWKMELCILNEINPSELSVKDFSQSEERFREFIKERVTKEGREFKGHRFK